MKVGVLFSGGKDSVYAAYLEKLKGNNLACLISVVSENKDSYMFHTPSILCTKKQAKAMKLPLITEKTRGEKEEELKDLERAIKKAISEYQIEGIVTGAIKSEYQSSRIQKICDKLKLKCLNPLWKTDEIEYLKDLVRNNFKVIIVGVFAYPLDNSWLGREINEKFINDVKSLKEKYSIHPAGEGGEFESLVLNCPLFSKPLNISGFKDIKEGTNAWRREIKLK